MISASDANTHAGQACDLAGERLGEFETVRRKSVVISKKKRSDLQFIAPKQCAKNQSPQCEIRTRPPTLIGERHQFAAHLTITFIPSRAIRASTPSSRATAAIFAASWRSLAVTISEPQCVIIARDTRSFAHQPSWVRTGA